jgi:hypothetical protein
VQSILDRREDARPDARRRRDRCASLASATEWSPSLSKRKSTSSACGQSREAGSCRRAALAGRSRPAPYVALARARARELQSLLAVRGRTECRLHSDG